VFFVSLCKTSKHIYQRDTENTEAAQRPELQTPDSNGTPALFIQDAGFLIGTINESIST